MTDQLEGLLKFLPQNLKGPFVQDAHFTFSSFSLRHSPVAAPRYSLHSVHSFVPLPLPPFHASPAVDFAGNGALAKFWSLSRLVGSKHNSLTQITMFKIIFAKQAKITSLRFKTAGWLGVFDCSSWPWRPLSICSWLATWKNGNLEKLAQIHHV